MQNLLIASVLAVASAEAFYQHQLRASGLGTWPSTSHGYDGSSSTVYGAHGYRIGKRSADADAYYGYPATTVENHNNVYGHQSATQYAISQPHGFGHSYQQVSRLHSGLHYGGYYGKRSAEPFYGGVAVHPGQAVSSTQRSAQGLSLGYGYGHGYGHGLYGYGKRSAEAGAAVTVENHNNVYGHQSATQYAISQPHGFGHSGSYQQVSRLHSGLHYGGYYGKRSADAFYGGVAVHPGQAVSSTQRSAQGLSLGYGYGHGFYGYGKRSADAYYGAATSAYSVNQAHPGYAAGSYQQVSRLHSGIGYGYGAGYLY